ncbi:MAG TPA: glutaredoxin family protein [Candidatus Limnocylindrales bacterium]|nr:glutaredoxin family protein [Candidatus Limnocylindrales bacterium]
MKPKLTLYSRRECCLCDEMKAVIRQVAIFQEFDFEDVDIDASRELEERYNEEVPVLFIDGRKAFKYRVTAVQLAKRINKKR